MSADALTPQQQVALTAGLDFWNTQPAGVASILLCDGPHGLRKQTGGGFSLDSVPATCFPTASAMAATWDPALMEEVGVALGAEARAENVSVLLGPGANIKRTAICGRNFEYFSEDPLLSSRMAAAWIRGVQSTGVGASLKHFAANNQEQARFSIDTIVDERALRELYLASFEFAVRTAQPATIMAAYNQVNGDFCTENAYLLTTVLRDEWGFDGVVVSDWGATNDRATGIAAGLDLQMPGFAGAGDAEVLAALHSGTLSAAALNRAARAMVRLVDRTGPARQGDPTASVDPTAVVDRGAHDALARRAAAAGTVLLKNDGGLLPLAAQTTSIAVIGAFAEQPRYQGAGSSGINPFQVDSAWSALTAAVDAPRLRYAPGYVRHSSAGENSAGKAAVGADAACADTALDAALIAKAVEAAAASDVAVVFVGLPETSEIEGLDRPDIELPPAHNAVIAAVAAVNPRVVVVLNNGAPVAMPWHRQVSSIVEGYLGGQAGGSAVVNVLLGVSEPGGRLAETFPHQLADNPVHALPTGPRQVEYRESVFVGYRYYDTAAVDVLFPFGHGLSYTTFDWSDPLVRTGSRLTEASLVDGGEVEVTLTVTNTGPRAGSDVVQLYVRDVAATAFRPAHELKAFAKVHLAPGESETVTLRLDHRAFATWNAPTGDWVVEAGDFELQLAASSRDVRATLRVSVDAPDRELDPGPSAYHAIGPGALPDRASFERLYGRALPANAAPRRGQYTVNTPIAQLHHPVARLQLAIMRRAAHKQFRDAQGTPAGLLVDSMLREITPRMLAMASQGRLGADFGRALIQVCNGSTVAGLRAMARALRGAKPR